MIWLLAIVVLWPLAGFLFVLLLMQYARFEARRPEPGFHARRTPEAETVIPFTFYDQDAGS